MQFCYFGVHAFLIWQVLFLSIVVPFAVPAEIKLDLQTAINRALENNLELQAKREEIGIAEGQSIKGTRFLQNNPELEGDIAIRRLKKPQEGFKKNLQVGGISLSQECKMVGQPSYCRQRVPRSLERVKLEVKDIDRIIRFRITDLFLRVMNSRVKIKQAQQIVNLRERLYEASKTRLALADIPESQLILAEFETNRAKSNLIEFQREYEDQLSSLKVELALKEDKRIEPVGDLRAVGFSRSLDELLTTAVEKRTNLAALKSAQRTAEAELHIASAARIPDVKFGVFFECDEEYNIVGDMSLIPIPFSDHRQVQLHKALSRKNIADVDYRNLRQAIEKRVRAAYEIFKLNERNLSIYPEGIMKSFDENLELNQKAYQEGEIGLSEVILFQNKVNDARLQFLDTLMNYNLSLAKLKFLAGIE